MTITKKLNRDTIYVITEDEGLGGRFFKAGELVKAIDNLTSERPRFKSLGNRKPDQAADTGWHTAATNVTIYGATPVESAGIELGKKYQIIGNQSETGSIRLNVGDIVTLTSDDKSSQPCFTRVSDGVKGYVFLTAIGDVVKTPAELAGLVIGQEYEVITDFGSGSSLFQTGDVVKFTDDDGTNYPGFRRVSDNDFNFVKLTAIGPVKKKTPAEVFGLKVGGKARIVRGSGTGNIVTLLKDDGTDIPEFTKADGETEYLSITRMELYNGSPVEAAGYKIGDKFRLLANSRDFFVEGSIITLTRDDGTRVPEFTGPKRSDPSHTNYKGYAGLDEITPYKPTPMEEAGYKVGDKVEVTTAYNFSVGDVLVITRDDGDAMPKVKLANGSGGERYERITRFKPYVAPVTKTVRIVVNGSTVESKELTQAQLDAVLAALPKPVVPVTAAPADFQQPYLIGKENTNGHCFKEGDVVYVKRTYDHTESTLGMSKNSAATKMDACGNVHTKEMTKIQAYKIVGNTTSHCFKTGDVVYVAGPHQDGATRSKPFYRMSKDPAAKHPESAGGVYLSDIVAI